jgi:hypothetical protein
MKTADQKIAELRREIDRLTEKSRAEAARGKIVAGGALIAAARADQRAAHFALGLLQRFVSRPEDRKSISPIVAELEGLVSGNVFAQPQESANE